MSRYKLILVIAMLALVLAASLVLPLLGHGSPAIVEAEQRNDLLGSAPASLPEEGSIEPDQEAGDRIAGGAVDRIDAVVRVEGYDVGDLRDPSGVSLILCRHRDGHLSHHRLDQGMRWMGILPPLDHSVHGILAGAVALDVVACEPPLLSIGSPEVRVEVRKSEEWAVVVIDDLTNSAISSWVTVHDGEREYRGADGRVSIPREPTGVAKSYRVTADGYSSRTITHRSPEGDAIVALWVGGTISVELAPRVSVAIATVDTGEMVHQSEDRDGQRTIQIPDLRPGRHRVTFVASRGAASGEVMVYPKGVTRVASGELLSQEHALVVLHLLSESDLAHLVGEEMDLSLVDQDHPRGMIELRAAPISEFGFVGDSTHRKAHLELIPGKYRLTIGALGFSTCFDVVPGFSTTEVPIECYDSGPLHLVAVDPGGSGGPDIAWAFWEYQGLETTGFARRPPNGEPFHVFVQRRPLMITAKFTDGRMSAPTPWIPDNGGSVKLSPSRASAVLRVQTVRDGKPCHSDGSWRVTLKPVGHEGSCLSYGKDGDNPSQVLCVLSQPGEYYMTVIGLGRKEDSLRVSVPPGESVLCYAVASHGR